MILGVIVATLILVRIVVYLRSLAVSGREYRALHADYLNLLSKATQADEWIDYKLEVESRKSKLSKEYYTELMSLAASQQARTESFAQGRLRARWEVLEMSRDKQISFWALHELFAGEVHWFDMFGDMALQTNEVSDVYHQAYVAYRLLLVEELSELLQEEPDAALDGALEILGEMSHSSKLFWGVIREHFAERWNEIVLSGDSQRDNELLVVEGFSASCYETLTFNAQNGQRPSQRILAVLAHRRPSSYVAFIAEKGMNEILSRYG